MAIKHTVWHPDTCGCVVTLAWDDAVPIAQREHTAVDVKPCKHHMPTERASRRAIVEIAAPVLAENQRKNRAVGAVLQANPDLVPDDVQWGLDEQRNVRLRVPKLQGRQQALRAAVSAKLGTDADRIVIE